MSPLTLTIAALALCILQAHAAFNYRYTTPSPSRSHEAAYTAIEVTIPARTPAPRDSIRQFGLFHRSSPSPSGTPVPIVVQSPIVINPHTEGPTKTPTPVLQTQNVSTAPVNTESRWSFIAPSTKPIYSDPALTLIPLPSSGAVSLSSAPAPSHPLASPSPHFVKRVIAIPLRIPTRRFPYRKLSTSPSTSPIDINQQPGMVLNSPFPHVPFPSPILYMAREAAEIGQAGEKPTTLTSSTSPSPSQLDARHVDDATADYELIHTQSNPPSADLVSPLPPRPSGTMSAEKTIAVEIRFKKMLHATPLPMASASAAPSREPVLPEPLPPTILSDVRLGKVYINSDAPSPAVSVNPHDVKDHVYTIAPSIAPHPPVYDVRIVQRHRIPSIKVMKQTASPDETIKPTASASVDFAAAVDNTPPIVNVTASPTYTRDAYVKTARLSLQADTAEPYCDSVKKCMCVIIPYKLLSPSLRLYCKPTDELASSVCEKSKEAQVFLEFWSSMEGAEGLEIISKCAPDMLQLS